VGITTTLPVEVIYAAGMRPVDLNNVFITSEDPGALLAKAEAEGFPRSVCAWIKGIYAAVMEAGIERVVAVTGGDCSNAIALAEVLERRGVQIYRFDYPLDRDRSALERQVERLMEGLGAEWEGVARVRAYLDRIRAKLHEIDRLTYEEARVNGAENHIFLVNGSDFKSAPEHFEAEVDAFLSEAAGRSPLSEGIRIGHIGVPPVFTNFYESVEQMGGRVVYNEIQRQFCLPSAGKDLIEAYLLYTYPYGIDGRIRDIRTEIRKRDIHGLVHYTQTFCHRQIHDILLRESLDVPILTLEGDRPGRLDGRTLTRLETFMEMLGGI
jgi:benzoyl-CoA reductase/2-hydroxyglutaryl-CoA dehydratase subunit BcrC/BadD/HgdB